MVGEREQRIRGLRANVSDLSRLIVKAQLSAAGNPKMALTQAYRSAEAICRSILQGEVGEPGKPMLDELLMTLLERKLLPRKIHAPLGTVQIYAHLGTSAQTETGEEMDPGYVGPCLLALEQVTRWYFTEYLGVQVPTEIERARYAAASSAPGPELPPEPAPSSAGSQVQRLFEKAQAPDAVNAANTVLEAVGTPHLRVLEPGHRWFPRQLHDGQRREAARLGIPVAIEDEATGIAMVLIPGATYWMGRSPGDGSAYDDEKPRYQVTVEPFYAGIGPVLQEQWERVTGQNPSVSRGPTRPVEQVSFDDVREFLTKANAGRYGRGLRLPSEAEWELAARGGTETCYWWGNDLREELANSEDGGSGETSDVGRYSANPYGLLDILGNVWEWCEDSWNFRWHRAPTDGRAWVGDGELRVVRGGSWNSDSGCLRVSFRHCNKVDYRNAGLGFRLVRDAVIP